jgi:hypothetical protein
MFRVCPEVFEPNRSQAVHPGVRGILIDGAALEVPDHAVATTRALLAAGVLAGPLFVGISVVQAISRQGFDLRRHGISLLSLGDRGWIQIANFVLAGALSIAFAVGIRRVLQPGFGATSAPLLTAGYGVGLIVTGVFLVDAGAGFPPGTAQEIPAELSWHGTIHAIAPPSAFVMLVGVCGIFAVRFRRLGRSGWSRYCALTGLASLCLIFWPGGGGSVRSAVAVLITSVWLTALAAELMVELRSRAPA